MLSVAVVTGSTRPGRNNEAVTRWVYDTAKVREDVEFEPVDIAEYKQPPLLDEPMSPLPGKCTHQHTRKWAGKIASFDAYVFVTPEYILAELVVATVHAQAMLSMLTDFENFTTFKPDPMHTREVHVMLDQVIAWDRRAEIVPLRTAN